MSKKEELKKLADQQRAEAKRLLGRHLVTLVGADQAVADRIVDCIIGAAIMETSGMFAAIYCRDDGTASAGAHEEAK